MATTVEVVGTDRLSRADLGAWRAFADADIRFDSPFLKPDYALIAGRIAPKAAVAVVRRRGGAIAFLPFQARGRGLQPLAAPLTDYHGLVAAPGEHINPAEVLRRLDAAAFAATAWIGDAPPGRLQVRRRMTADLGGGFDVWRDARARAGGSIKDKARRLRALERDHGAPVFALHDPDPAAFAWLIARKREQYRATGQHDVFACGWTTELLAALLQSRRPGLGGALATLRVGGRLIAAEYALQDDRTHHLWFPAYDPEFARYSPGSLLLLEALRRAAGEGIARADFGGDVEGYKADFAEPGDAVFEGVLSASAAAPAVRTVAADAFARWRFRAERRLGVIRACEVSRVRTAAASLRSLLAFTRRCSSKLA